MKTFVAASLGLVVLAGPQIAAQRSRVPVEGVWRIAQARISGPNARTIDFKEMPNQMILTAKHYSRVEIQSPAPRPALADPAKATADELRAAWGPLVAEAGTYEVSGDHLTMRPIASKNPAVMGPDVFITYSYKLDGKTLSLTQERNQKGPISNPFTLEFTRVE